MLEITVKTLDPSNYLLRRNVEPDLEENKLIRYEGQGEYRSWGTPFIKSQEILNTDELACLLTSFFTKHSRGQFYSYYLLNNEVWEEVTWAKLNDHLRHRILIAYEDRAPSWAKEPGKLRDQYKRPTMTRYTTYKIVQVRDGRYYSLYNGTTEYILGKRLTERAVTDHRGGYYSYPSREGLEALLQDGKLIHLKEQTMKLALLEVEISGTLMYYDRAGYPIECDEYGSRPIGVRPHDTFKIASTYIRPIKELKMIEYIPQREAAH